MHNNKMLNSVLKTNSRSSRRALGVVAAANGGEPARDVGFRLVHNQPDSANGDARDGINLNGQPVDANGFARDRSHDTQ